MARADASGIFLTSTALCRHRSSADAHEWRWCSPDKTAVGTGISKNEEYSLACGDRRRDPHRTVIGRGARRRRHEFRQSRRPHRPGAAADPNRAQRQAHRTQHDAATAGAEAGNGCPDQAAPQPGGFMARNPFLSGLMGGMLGAGLIGMLFGGGFAGGLSGGAGMLGLLLQVLLIGGVAYLAVRLFRGWSAARAQPAGPAYAYAAAPGMTEAPMARSTWRCPPAPRPAAAARRRRATRHHRGRLHGIRDPADRRPDRLQQGRPRPDAQPRDAGDARLFLRSSFPATPAAASRTRSRR